MTKFGGCETGRTKIINSRALQECKVSGSLLKFRKPENFMPRGHTVPNSSTIMEVKQLQKCGTKQVVPTGKRNELNKQKSEYSPPEAWVQH